MMEWKRKKEEQSGDDVKGEKQTGTDMDRTAHIKVGILNALTEIVSGIYLYFESFLCFGGFFFLLYFQDMCRNEDTFDTMRDILSSINSPHFFIRYNWFIFMLLLTVLIFAAVIKQREFCLRGFVFIVCHVVVHVFAYYHKKPFSDFDVILVCCLLMFVWIIKRMLIKIQYMMEDSLRYKYRIVLEGNIRKAVIRPRNVVGKGSYYQIIDEEAVSIPSDQEKKME